MYEILLTFSNKASALDSGLEFLTVVKCEMWKDQIKFTEKSGYELNAFSWLTLT